MIMIDLETYLDEKLDSDVMDVIITKIDGSPLREPNYSDYLVVDVKYEEEDGFKNAYITVKRFDE